MRSKYERTVLPIRCFICKYSPYRARESANIIYYTLRMDRFLKKVQAQRTPLCQGKS